MKKVEIEYKWLGLIKKTYTRNCPESWKEVNPEQIIAVSRLYLDEISESDFIRRFFRIPRLVAASLDGYMVYTLIDTLDFIQDYTPRESFIIPKLPCGIPPKPALNGLRFGRFIFIDSYFSDYAQNQENETALNKLIATLYWPGNKKFSEELIPAQVKITAALSPDVKQAIAINYRLVKDWLSDRYPLVFSKSVSNNENSKKDASWLKVFDSIVNDDIINSDKYADMLLHDVLRYLTRKIKENAKRS
ncbi:MAG: hypothetical protein AB7C90_05105 [Bacteroidales bacterium]